MCNIAFPAEVTNETRPLCRRYQDQVIVPLLYATTLRASERTARVTERVGIFLREDGKFGDSEKLLSRAVKIFSEVSGDDDESTLRSHAQLAWTLYVELGRPEQAAEILQSTLWSLRALSFGDDHPNTLCRVAATYYFQGRLDDAFALDEQVLAARCRKVLGEDHPDTLRAKINLAGSYCERRKWGKTR